jgi:hypothetical protein
MNAFTPAVSSASKPPLLAAGAPTRCEREDGATGNEWFQQPGPLGILIMLSELNAAHDRLELMAKLPGMSSKVSEAASQLGRVERRYSLEFNSWNRGKHLAEVVRPTHGACVADSLWGALGEIREQAICDQLKAEGKAVYYNSYRSDPRIEEYRDRYEEIDRDMPTVEAALQAMGVGL